MMESRTDGSCSPSGRSRGGGKAMSSILIITNDHDEHADAVIRELNTRGVQVLRFHPEEFPHACSITIEIQDGRIDGEIRNADHV